MDHKMIVQKKKFLKKKRFPKSLRVRASISVTLQLSTIQFKLKYEMHIFIHIHAL